jgi:hypothetical protein
MKTTLYVYHQPNILTNLSRTMRDPLAWSVTSPLEKGDHLELDTSKLCTTEQIAQYQSMIGALQWIVTIGRLDINTAVMTMSGFYMAPRVGQLNRLRRIYGYLWKMKNASIRVRTEKPDKVEELLPVGAPEPLGNHVTLSSYVDANLMHDISTGRSVTMILSLVNKTPIEWYSKKQATVETATYGSEFVAARVCAIYHFEYAWITTGPSRYCRNTELSF